MHRVSWDAHQAGPRQQGQVSAAHGCSDDSSSWTPDDEAQSLIRNRGFATDQYVRGSCLGSGGWSRVYKVRSVAGGRVVAGKSSEAIAEMQRESAILQSLQHDHVLKFIDWYQERGKPAATLLVTELCGHGTLQTRIDRASPNMDRREMLQVVEQMGSALDYLHGQGLFHTDVKPRNILVRGLQPMDVVLADCADVQRMGDTRGRQLRGTPSYYSPEMVQHGVHGGPGDDVWALGMTLLGMAAQWPPLRHTKQDLRRYPRRCADHAQALLALNPRHGMVRLLAGMLAPAPDKRVSARACADRAGELLGAERPGPPAEYELGIEAPRDFRPISFW